MSEEPERKTTGEDKEHGGAPRPRHAHAVHPLSLMHRHALLALWLGVVVLAAMASAFWLAHYLESPEVHERARRLVIARIEGATGARVDLESMGWNLHKLEFELAGLQIHGKEAAGEAPLLQVERATARLKWSQLLAGHLAMRTLLVIRPMAHLIVYDDGSTNLPDFKAPVRREPMLRLAMDRLEAVDGRLDWNSRRIRLDGVAEGIFLLASHTPDGHYEGNARVGQVRMRVPQAEPLIMNAEAQFRLYRDRVEVPRLRVNERGWVLEASGTASNPNSPVAQFSYRAVGDAAELARVLRYRELRSGALQVSGQANYRAASGEFAAVGKAQASDVRWQNETIRLEKISGGFQFSLDGHPRNGTAAGGSSRTVHLNIPALFATALGGTVHGTMQATLAPDKDASGRLELKVAGVDLERTFGAFTTRELPLDRLALAGATTGKLDVSWRGNLQDAQMQGDLQVSPVAHAGRLPVSAVVQGRFDFKDQAARLEKVEAHSARTYLSANGQLSASSDLNLDLRTTDVSEVMPLVEAWRGGRAQQLPLEFAGPASFLGAMQGRLQSPALAGHLELHDLTATLRIPANVAGGMAKSAHVTREHWDSLSGEVRYSSSAASLRNGFLLRGRTRVGLDAALTLANGSFNANLPFSAALKLQNMDAGELQTLLGTAYPVTGQVNGELQFSGTALQGMSGTGRVALTEGTAWGQSVRSASADIALSRSEPASQVRLRNIAVNSDAMQLSGDARMNLRSREFLLELKGSQVRLEKLRALADRKIALTGVAAFEAHGEGTPSAPVINGRLSLRDLTYNGQSVGGADVEAVTHGAAMQLTAHSSFKSADLTLDGEVQLRGAMPARLRGDLRSTKLNSLLAPYLPVRLDNPSELKMHVEVSGEATHPREMTAVVDIERLAASYSGIAVSNDGPVRLRVDHQVLRIEQFQLTAERGSRFLRARGEVQLGSSHLINLRLDGSMNLKLLETMNPNLMAGGAANLNLQVNGTLDRPLMRGQLTVQNASIADIDFPNGLSNIAGSMFFNEDRLQIQELTARTGGGMVDCTGFLTYSPAQGVGFNLSANGHDIRLRYPEGLSSTADASLALSGTSKDALLSGQVTITRLGVNPRFDFAAYLVKGMRGAPAQRIDSPLNGLHMDVRVVSTQELQVQTSLARLSGNVDLRLRGTAFRPVALGRVNLLEGTLEFNGTKYRVERGDLTFTNPVRIDPTLDMELSARVRDYDITLGFQGPVDKLTTTYRSDPPLSSSDIISLLALGVTTEEQANPAMMGTAQYSPTVSESASNAVLGQALNATVGSRVQKLFGVSRVKIDPNVGQVSSAGLARVTVEQQVSNKVTLTYTSNLNQSAQEIIQFEYNVSKDMRVVGIRDQSGVLSFDMLFRKRKK